MSHRYHPVLGGLLTIHLVSTSKRQAFLAIFYSNAKAAFALFDQKLQHSHDLVTQGYTCLLNRISDHSLLNSLTFIAIGLDIPEIIMALIRARSIVLGIDFDRLYTTASSRITARRQELSSSR